MKSSNRFILTILYSIIMKTQQIDEHEIPQIILDQLFESKVHGFEFFKYTGIKGFLMMGNDTLVLKDIPCNPNKIERVSIFYDKARDSYNINATKKDAIVPSSTADDIHTGEMAEIITRMMGTY